MNLNPYGYARGNPATLYDAGGFQSDDSWFISACWPSACGGYYDSGYGGSGAWEFNSQGFSFSFSIGSGTLTDFLVPLGLSSDLQGAARGGAAAAFGGALSSAAAGAADSPNQAWSPAVELDPNVKSATEQRRRELIDKYLRLPCIMNDDVKSHFANYGIDIKKVLAGEDPDLRPPRFEITNDPFKLKQSDARGHYWGPEDVIYINPDFPFTTTTFTATLLHETGHYVAAHSSWPGRWKFYNDIWPFGGYGEPGWLDPQVIDAIDTAVGWHALEGNSGYAVEYLQFKGILTNTKKERP
jgi:hypothetical protein